MYDAADLRADYPHLSIEDHLVLAATSDRDFGIALAAANRAEVLSALRSVNGKRGEKRRTAALNVRLTQLLDGERG